MIFLLWNLVNQCSLALKKLHNLSHNSPILLHNLPWNYRTISDFLLHPIRWTVIERFIFPKEMTHQVSHTFNTMKGLSPGVISEEGGIHCMIVRVSIVLNRTIVERDWLFDNLCSSHLQTLKMTTQGCHNVSYCQQQSLFLILFVWMNKLNHSAAFSRHLLKSLKPGLTKEWIITVVEGTWDMFWKVITSRHKLK